jgi:C-terminal processing protease CtpA/Prc
VQTLAVKLKTNYVLPAVGERVGAAIVKKNAEGAYASATTADAFSAALTRDLRVLGNDGHFSARHDDSFRELTGDEAPPSRADMEAWREQVARSGFGIDKVERLPGNVGYIKLTGFGPTPFVGPAYTAAMGLMEGTDALILDLRSNKGGSAGSVAYLMSHFFPLGDVRHLNDMIFRGSNSTEQSWTVGAVAQRYDKPVYVLVSPRTFSAAEECAYDFQTQKRGTVVGETTGGAANPPRPFSVGHGIVAVIPVGQSINPITKASWEHVGVKPDIVVPPAQAQQTAHAAILRGLLASAKDETQRANLQRILAMVEKGETEAPDYSVRKN